MKLLQCPRCRLLLSPAEGGQVSVCISCGGAWVPAGTPMSAQSAQTQGRAATAFDGLPVPCPECAATSMNPSAGETGRWSCPRCRGEWRDFAETAKEPEPPVVTRPEPAPAPAVASVAAFPGQKLPETLSPGQAILKEFLEGNRRFAAGLPEEPNRTPDRRRETAQNPRPKAAIFSCADSRVPPEIVLDQGLGDLFVVRLAGNTLDKVALDTLEFAVGELGLPLVLILGHTRCAAVQAAVERRGEGNYLLEVMQELKPAAEWALTQPGNPVDHAIRENVRRQTDRLTTFLNEWAEDGRVIIQGAVYNVDSGLIEYLPRPVTPAPLEERAEETAPAFPPKEMSRT